GRLVEDGTASASTALGQSGTNAVSCRRGWRPDCHTLGWFTGLRGHFYGECCAAVTDNSPRVDELEGGLHCARSGDCDEELAPFLGGAGRHDGRRAGGRFARPRGAATDH